MSKEIRVPEVSDGVAQGKVIGISVAEGDRVEVDQTLLELETDKAVVALPAPFTGTITAIKVKDGDTVQIGAVVMEGEPEGAADAPPPPSARMTNPEPETPQRDPQPAPPAPEAAADPARKGSREAPESETPRAAGAPPARSESVAPADVAPASPGVRRFARELGVDIGAVPGTGPGGRIGEQDVRDFVKSVMQGSSTAAGAAPVARPLPDFTRWTAVTREPLSQVRRITADAMSHAWVTVPRVTQYDKADITGVEAFREEFNERASKETKLTMTAILLKVVAGALRAFPAFNSSLDVAKQELILKKAVHVGVAVDTPGGLLVPVVRDVDRKGIAALAVELNDLAARTRERRISPADMEGGGFTISNLGGIGGVAFSPIVYWPQVAILGVSRAELEPVWDGEGFEPRLRMPVSLSYDHRVIDGAQAARFLRWVCAALAQPLLLAMEGDER